MKKEEFFYPSAGDGQIHGCRWFPEGEPRAVVQIIHGIAEYLERYQDFAAFLTERGFLVVAEDHMGHGKSIQEGKVGYFDGGWFAAVEDSYQLLRTTREQYPALPYVLFGHSMGSFMTRTLLCRYPDSGIAAAVICGTGWQPRLALPGLRKVVEGVCKAKGETTPSPALEKMMFGAYNRRVEHPRTPSDWLTRDKAVVDAYRADPLCGFTPSAGLVRDLLTGLMYIENPENLQKMDKKLPVLFIAGGDDPVGAYGKGVEKAAQAFRQAGQEQVKCRIYPLGRHEILNEINREEVYQDTAAWIEEVLKD